MPEEISNTRIEIMEERVEKLSHTVYGNGKPGLAENVRFNKKALILLFVLIAAGETGVIGEIAKVLGGG